MANQTYNLTALAERLSEEGRLRPLAGKIERVQGLGSMHTDLRCALETTAALKAMVVDKHSDEFEGVAAELALLSNAIILYTRATKTSSTERKPFDLTSRFSSKQKGVHQEIVDLRDHAIAHFGSGGSYRGAWQQEFVVLQFAGGRLRPGVLTRRLTMDDSLLERLSGQIEVACALTLEMFHQKINGMTIEISGLAQDVFEAEILQYPLNLDIAVGSRSSAEEIRFSAEVGGYTKGVVRSWVKDNEIEQP